MVDALERSVRARPARVRELRGTGATSGGGAGNADGSSADAAADAMPDAGPDADVTPGAPLPRCWSPKLQPELVAANQRNTVSVVKHGGAVYWVDWGRQVWFSTGGSLVENSRLMRLAPGKVLESRALNENFATVGVEADGQLWMAARSGVGVLTGLDWMKVFEAEGTDAFAVGSARLLWADANGNSFVLEASGDQRRVHHGVEGPAAYAVVAENSDEHFETRWTVQSITMDTLALAPIADWTGRRTQCRLDSYPGIALTPDHFVANADRLVALVTERAEARVVGLAQVAAHVERLEQRRSSGACWASRLLMQRQSPTIEAAHAAAIRAACDEPGRALNPAPRCPPCATPRCRRAKP